MKVECCYDSTQLNTGIEQTPVQTTRPHMSPNGEGTSHCRFRYGVV